MGNLLVNPSFEDGPSDWGVSHGTLSVVSTSDAPDGTHVAQMAATTASSWMTLDQWPGTIINAAGQGYEGQSFVEAANVNAVGKTVQLILREDDSNGNYVDSWTTTATLTSNWQQLVVDGHAENAGDRLDLYVAELSPDASDVVQADAFSLVETSPTIAELALAYDQNAPDVNGSSPLGDTSKYAYVITQQRYGATSWTAGGQTELDTIRATSPHPEVFEYLNVATVKLPSDPATSDPTRSCTSNDASLPYLAYSPDQSTAVQSFSHVINFCWLYEHQHLDWLLYRSGCTDAANRPSYATYGDYPEYVALDVTNPAVRSQISQDAASADMAVGASAAPFDGLYLDDVNTHPGHGLDGIVGTCLNGSWSPVSDDDYGAGMAATITGIKSEVNKPLLANVGVKPWGDWSANEEAVATIASSAGINREFFTQWGGASGEDECGPDFAQMDEYVMHNMRSYVSDNQSMRGTLVTTLDYGPTAGLSATYDADAQAEMRATRASFLLAWDGVPGSATMYRPCAGDPAPPSARTNLVNAQWTDDLGVPTGPAEVLATATNSDSEQSEALLRPFAKGYVVFNDTQTPVTVDLAGTFRGSDGTIYAGTVTIPGRNASNSAQGLLLTRLSY